MKTVVHITHEAVQKIGGIGAVLHGLLTSPAYARAVKRDILVGPLFETHGNLQTRLNGGEVLYSSLDGLIAGPWAEAFQRIEHDCGVHLVYGRKKFFDPLTNITSHPEVLLVDVHQYRPDKIGALKFMLYHDYNIASDRYEHVWDYEQYCRLAIPALDALQALGVGSVKDPALLLSHEYMGMPTALCARSWFQGKFKTIFYAHEVAPMRKLVEDNLGHDTMFYNVMKKATGSSEKKRYVEDIFENMLDYYKHPLVQAARYCDNIFAVGDYVKKELRFLHPKFEETNIDIAYNGVPAGKVTLDEKFKSREKLKDYCEILLGYRPDHLLTHVTRMVLSKGLWRDITIMEELEPLLRKDNKTAILFVLSTETAMRKPEDIRKMEKKYRWPIAHREGMPDLTDGEARLYARIQEFNAKARMAKIVFINQFGFDHLHCGDRMPESMEFLDIRKGSDAEFGMSIYEPFGIAQVEPICFGGICVFTELCGCAGFVRNVADHQPTLNAIEIDFTKLEGKASRSFHHATIQELLHIGESERLAVEADVAKSIAPELYRRLPRTQEDFEAYLARGQNLGEKMSWDAVATRFILPGFTRAIGNT